VGALTVVDDHGDRVEFTSAVERVVSLEPALSEMVCALKRCPLLVGVDRYSNWPRALESLPKLGGGIDPNVELVFRLRPQLVLSSRSALMKKKLGALNLKVLEFDMTSLEDVHRVLLTLAPALGVSLEDAQMVWQDMQDALLKTAAKVSPLAKGSRVYFEVSSDYFVAAKSSFLGELMERLGLVNVVGAQWGPFPHLNPEFIIAQNPQLIMIGHQSTNDLASLSAWADTDALKHSRVCHFNPDQFDVLSRPGPRVVQAMELMLQCVNQVYAK
jgi:iron complex transport system substrate-binding protein